MPGRHHKARDSKLVESARTLFWSGPRPVGEPSYARHVGRVGALAVALGIGSAIAVPGVAWADPSDGDVVI